jgi:hypothetical protein
MIERMLRIPMLGTMTAIVVALTWFLRPIDRSALFGVCVEDERVGFVDAGGRMAIPPVHRRMVQPFNEFGVAVVETDVNERRSWTSLIDRHGRILARANQINPFAPCGLALAYRGESGVFLDRAGKDVFSPPPDSCVDFSEAGLLSAESGGKFGYLDSSGKFAVPAEWDQVAVGTDIGAGPFPVSRDLKWGYVDRTGKLVVPLEWEEAYAFDESGLARVVKSGKHGFIDRTGRVVVPPEWDRASSFGADAIAPVCRKDRWGAVDRTGKLAIPCEWDALWHFDKSGLAAARRDFKFGFIDAAGKVAVPLEWDAVLPFGDSDLAAVRRDWKWGYVDRTGKLTIPLVWEEASAFGKAGVAKVIDRDQVAFLDRTGKIVVSATKGERGEVETAAGTSIHRIWVERSSPPEDTRPEWLKKTLAFIDHGDTESHRQILWEQYDTSGQLVWSSDWLSERTWMMLAAIGIGLLGIVEIGWQLSRKRGERGQ